jgi:hypothetical protein
MALTYHEYYTKLIIKYFNGSDIFGNHTELLIFWIMRSLIKIIFSLFIILTGRPSKINESGFNEVRFEIINF